MANPLIPYTPFGELSDLRERLDRVFADLAPGGEKPWKLSVDVIQEEDRYVVRADLPGVEPEDVKVEVEDDLLTVSAEHEETEEEKRKNYVRRERRYGSFSRSMTLPAGVEAEDVEATVDKGVVEVSIPKPKAAGEKAKRVEIKPKAAAD